MAWENLYRDAGWVFTYEDGRPLNPNYLSATFRQFVARIGLHRLTFLGLPHEHTSLLLPAGMPITAVSQRLGRASSGITGDLYSHLLDDTDRHLADAIERALRGTQSRVHTQCAHTTTFGRRAPRGEEGNPR
ncbi:tyrosine-type recombinase/integrase [Amnibacterium sp.]|uniref:tyrosine-type recombinase/integrase n=1 Tax=Amnibacterium sp. TaxID=1872496 RepID=UPI0026281B15|nr:tyrosine-type recombinase/integrase [Amnibacterium sp.]MCU1472116.1 hypothetical protein [Amnibacterium sp.]